MRKSKRKQIIREFDQSISMNLDLLAQVMNVSKKVIRVWREADLISYPVKKEEYETLVKFVNSTWCNRQMLRAQLSKLPVSERYHIALTADLTVFERELYNYVLRWKLIMPNVPLIFHEARSVMEQRFPNAVKQMDYKMFKDAKKWSSNLIQRTKKNGKDLMLLNAFDLKYCAETGIIDRRKVPTKAELRERNQEIVASQKPLDEFAQELDDLAKMANMKVILNGQVKKILNSDSDTMPPGGNALSSPLHGYQIEK